MNPYQTGTHEGKWGFWSEAFDLTLFSQHESETRQKDGVDLPTERVFFTVGLPKSYQDGATVTWVGHLECCPNPLPRIQFLDMGLNPKTFVALCALNNGFVAIACVIPQKENFIPVEMCCISARPRQS